MTPAPLTTVGLMMPNDFPSAAYEAVVRVVNVDKWTQHPSWGDFAGAWNGLAYRFTACAEHDERFTGSVRQAGSAPPAPERYIQERELFGFFVTGLSALECVAYGCFALGSMVAPAHFLFVTPTEKRDVSTATTARRMQQAFTADPLAGALDGVAAAPEFKDWSAIRNILIHRSTPRRTMRRFLGSTRGAGATTWGAAGVPIDTQTTAVRRAWLAERLTAVITATEEFVAARF